MDLFSLFVILYLMEISKSYTCQVHGSKQSSGMCTARLHTKRNNQNGRPSTNSLSKEKLVKHGPLEL